MSTQLPFKKCARKWGCFQNLPVYHKNVPNTLKVHIYLYHWAVQEVLTIINDWPLVAIINNVFPLVTYQFPSFFGCFIPPILRRSSWRSTATDKSSSRCLRGAAMDGTMCISSTKRRGIIAICLGCFLPDDLPSTKHGNPCCFHIGYDLLSWTLPVTVPATSNANRIKMEL